MKFRTQGPSAPRPYWLVANLLLVYRPSHDGAQRCRGAPVRSGRQFRGCATKLDFGRRNFVASCHEIHAEDGVLPSVFTPYLLVASSNSPVIENRGRLAPPCIILPGLIMTPPIAHTLPPRILRPCATISGP